VSFRRKLLLVFALTVVLSVITVAWIASVVTRRAFEQADNERSTALVAQFRHEFARRGQEVARRVRNIAAGESATRMAAAAANSPRDYGVFVNDAKTMASEQQLDFLEFVDGDGTILSSAHWPAKFGYKESNFSPSAAKEAILRKQEIPDGMALGMCATYQVPNGSGPVYVIGGQRLDKDFLASLELPAGMRVLFYQNLESGFSQHFLLNPAGVLQDPAKLAPLIDRARSQNQEVTEIVHWSGDAAEDEAVHAIPLSGDDNHVLGVLLAGTSRRPYVELLRRIRSGALLATGAGLVFATLFSSWVGARVTRPVVQLAEAAREVAAGNWYAQAEVTSSDELGELSESFNRMTRDLLEQRERLVQTERIAAWRELARRLAHELKNPLFPLQLTVENLIRARQQSPEQFEEIFQESSATLLAEIANLKAVVARFSDFARMPQPQLRSLDLNELIRNATRLFQAQFQSASHGVIECKLDLDEELGLIEADPELLHRALSNLLLNAVDAMPQGGTLTVATRKDRERVILSVSDTGVGMTGEECAQLFTPYYTSKMHGTGLGLAIVQSVISDHHGRVSVTSKPGAGSTFVIELPRTAQQAQTISNWKGFS
jgi:two-component system nitrogen regulation sensor histidine kinase NtrY